MIVPACSASGGSRVNHATLRVAGRILFSLAAPELLD